MITVISGTNRKKSGCLKFAKKYSEFLEKEASEAVRLLAMDELPYDWFHDNMYDKKDQGSSLAKVQDKYMIPADKFVFITPEYNGSYPGVLKLFIDACSIRDMKPTFESKKAALIGIATGRAGNLRGMDHLSGVLNHLGITVMPAYLPISRIQDLVNGTGAINDHKTLDLMLQHAKDFISF